MMRQLFVMGALATIAIMLMQIPSTTACMCMPKHSQSSYCSSDYVILARILRKSNRRINRNDVYKIEVKKAYKKSPQTDHFLREGRLLTPAVNSLCGGLNLKVGKLYLIAANSQNINICNYVKEYSQMTIVERRGFAGGYKKGCACEVGTLDQLVGLSDDLGKLDGYVESITRKVATYLGEVLEDQRDKLQENLLANNSPGPPDEYSPLELQPSDLGTTFTQHNHNLNNNHSSANLNHNNNNYNHIHGGHHAIVSDNTEYGSRQGSLSSERDCDSCACSGNNSGGNGGSETESPNEPYTQTADNDVFDWWFHRNRSSKKSRSRSSSQLFYNGTYSTYRSSPVSSCCGSSQGRSSPEVDIDGETIGEPPHMPLSPADLPSYITRFQWDMAKYPIKQSLRNIADIISKQVGQIDADLKNKSQTYNNLKGNLQNLEKKQTGSLLTRNLADLVKKEHFILDSEYLTTLLVIVPKANVNDWSQNYEKITDMIVPRSSQLITQDADYALFNVTLFKKVVEEFKLHAREKKFVVRDFTYNEEELAAGKSEITKLVTDKKKQFGPLVRWLKVNFSETFCAWIHVKALRVFVESVLRYGLPVNFQAILIHPNKKSVKRLRDVLNQLYSHLDGSASAPSSNADNVDIPGLGFGQSEYYPYVHYKLNIDMVESKI